MIKIAIAVDSFKGSLTSMEAGNAAKEGILRAISDTKVDVFSMADGGEGTMTALAEGLHADKTIHMTACDPLGRKIPCEYAVCTEKMQLLLKWLRPQS